MTPELAIVVPMAGLGSRFQAAGYTTPKPLIPAIDRPMYAWAVESLPLAQASRLIFILLRSQPGYESLRADILARFAALRPIVIDVPRPTRGQSETVLAARQWIDNDEPLLIHNADTAFDADPAWASHALDSGVDGALLVFESQETRWSYSREGPDGWVAEVREKKPISPWASNGCYWFRRGRQFVALAEQAIREGLLEGNEFYVGPLYNHLIAGGGRVKNYPIRELYCLGTPEDLDATLPLLRQRQENDAAAGPPVWTEIVCPVRNGGEPFARTLRAIAQLKCPRPVRLLISDNHSTDGAPWRRGLGEIQNAPVRLITPPAPLGRVEHWHWAFAEARAEWVKPLLVGDTLKPDYLEHIHQAAGRHPAAGLIFCQNEILDPDKVRLTSACFPANEMDFDEFLAVSARHGNFIGALSGVIVRTEVLGRCAPFAPEHPWTADCRFYRDAARVRPVLGLREPLCALDRTIPRFSSSFGAIGSSLREEWCFMAELQREAGVPRLAALRRRCALLVPLALAKYGQRLLPKGTRRLLGALYRKIAGTSES